MTGIADYICARQWRSRGAIFPSASDPKAKARMAYYPKCGVRFSASCVPTRPNPKDIEYYVPDASGNYGRKTVKVTYPEIKTVYFKIIESDVVVPDPATGAPPVPFDPRYKVKFEETPFLEYGNVLISPIFPNLKLLDAQGNPSSKTDSVFHVVELFTHDGETNMLQRSYWGEYLGSYCCSQYP